MRSLSWSVVPILVVGAVAPVSGSGIGAISGPAVVAGYGLCALAVLVGIIVARRRLSAGAASAAAGELEGQPYAMAYLNGGPERALMAVLASMRVAGTLGAHGREVCAEGQLDGSASELERAVSLSAATPIRWDYLDADPTVSRELQRLRCWLEDAGLLLSAEHQRRIKHTGWWMVAAGVLGLPVIAGAGVANGAAAGVLILTLLAALTLLTQAPRLSRRGTAQMQALRAQYAALDPQMRPDSSADGPAYAGLAVGIFGTSALLQETDPDFAQLLAHGYPRAWTWNLGPHL